MIFVLVKQYVLLFQYPIYKRFSIIALCILNNKLFISQNINHVHALI